MSDFWATVGELRVVPVVSRVTAAEAEPLGDSLVRGGLPLVEVTLRHPYALDGLECLARRGDVLVGAGTVRTADQLRRAVDAGAAFAVSPCLSPTVAAAAGDLGLPLVPGVATATEIQHAVDLGLTTVKFFPAQAMGGIDALRALAEPFFDVRFMPTGGISAVTAPAYLSHPQVVAVGGSWMIPRAQREAGDWEAVTAAIAAVLDAAGKETSETAG